MYIHIGNDLSLPDLWIVAVFDMDIATQDSLLCREFLSRAEREGRLEWLGPEIPRSVIVTLDRVYLTPVSAQTLKARFQEARKIQLDRVKNRSKIINKG